MLTREFNRRLFVQVLLGFILCTIIGTLTHELGHCAVAKSLGYEVRLYYGSMEHFPKGYEDHENVKEIVRLNRRYKNIPFDSLDVSVQNTYKELFIELRSGFPQNRTHDMLVTLGGPLQTILMSFIGLVILGYRKSRTKKRLDYWDWIGVFLGLFVLREVFNTVMAVFDLVFLGRHGFSGDEFRLSLYFNLHSWTIPILTMILGFIITLYIIFRVIPVPSRLTFIMGGFLGGILGFGIWFGFLGNMLFPIPN